MTQNAIDNAASELTIDPGASGDSFVQFDINTTGEFRIGVDDTDDSFRISQGSSLGTNDTLVITADGERTLPQNPAFFAFLPSTDLNVTGDGTFFLVGDTDTATALTEEFDIGGNFNNGTSGGAVFTAPVSGRYVLGGRVLITGFTAPFTSGLSKMSLSNYSTRINLDPSVTSQLSLQQTIIAELDAADTFKLAVQLNDTGGKIDDLIGGTGINIQTNMWAYLAT